jgi:hypothetical protein
MGQGKDGGGAGDEEEGDRGKVAKGLTRRAERKKASHNRNEVEMGRRSDQMGEDGRR